MLDFTVGYSIDNRRRHDGDINEMVAFLDTLVFSGAQGTTALYVAVFLMLGWFIGWTLRRPVPEAIAYGLIVLAGAAAFTFAWSKMLNLPSAFYGFLVVANIAWVIYVLRRQVFLMRDRFEGSVVKYLIAIALPVAGLLIVNLVQPDASADIASHQGWDPLYVDAAFARGFFFDPRTTTLGNGYLVSISYLGDLIGLTAFGKWLGLTNTYAIYNAGATACSIAAVLVLTYTFQHHLLAQVCYVVMLVILLRVDGVFRLFVGYNYSEAILYLGGALVCYALVARAELHRALLAAAGASLFLVFSRHYGAFYAACYITIALIWTRLRDRTAPVRPSLILMGCLFVFTLQEFIYIVYPPSDFYPAGKLVTSNWASTSQLGNLLLTLNDLGFTYRGVWPADARLLRSLCWLFVILFAVRAIVLEGPARAQALRALMPVTVLIFPFVLQILTGYRTTADYNKMFVLGIFFHGWYLAYGLMICLSFPRVAALMDELCEKWNESRWRIFVTTMAGIAVVFALSGKLSGHRIVVDGPQAYLRWAFATYRKTNADMNIARLIKARFGDQSAQLAARPVLYLHYEPGVSLRLYLGGDLFRDLDFWSPPVQEKIAVSQTFSDLLDALGRPNVYFSLGSSIAYSKFFEIASLEKFASEMADPVAAGWATEILRFKTSQFVVTMP